jgi:hypothetical protein
MCGCEDNDSNLQKEIRLCYFCVAQKTKYLKLRFCTWDTSSAPFRFFYVFFKHINIIFEFLNTIRAVVPSIRNEL